MSELSCNPVTLEWFSIQLLEIYGWKFTGYPIFSVCANNIVQKRTVFVLTESWSRDQLLQKAYSTSTGFPVQVDGRPRCKGDEFTYEAPLQKNDTRFDTKE